MTEQKTAARRFINETPAVAIARLPRIGRLMVIGKRNGVTHERIGAIESIAEDNGFLLCRGEYHDSRIDPATITQMVIDTSSIMREQAYPRIDFNGNDGQPVFSIVGFGGLEPFEAALEGLSLEEEAADYEKPERPQRDALLPEDPGFEPLNAALASASTVTISFEQPGFSQRWVGVVPKVSPGMGFINVMTEDFHLHLLGGTVSRWSHETTADGVLLKALDANEQPTGLSLYANDIKAFAAVPEAVAQQS